MTISGNSAMSSYVSQVYSNKNVQSQSGASGTWTDNSAQSFDAIAQQLMSALDTNNNGTIDKTEFSQAAQALSNNTAETTKVDSAFSKADQNGDGQISSDEFLNALKQASAQTQKQHHPKPTADTAASQTNQSTPSDSALSLTQMQKNLLSKIIAAYGNATPNTGTTTNLSA